MPLITRRSSTRALPRVSVGRCGLIFENCAFVSQNWSRLIYASFSEAVNHATTLVPTLLWVQTLDHPASVSNTLTTDKQMREMTVNHIKQWIADINSLLKEYTAHRL